MSESVNTNKLLTEDSALVIWNKVKEEIGKIVIPEGGLTPELVSALIDAKINPLINNSTPEIDTINEIKAFLSGMEGKTLKGITDAIEAKIITEEERNNLAKVITLTDYAINNYNGVVYNIQDPTAGVVGTTEGILLPIERAKIGLDGNVVASVDNRLIKLATTSLHGIMSKLDKQKLDSIQEATTEHIGLLSISDKQKLDALGSSTDTIEASLELTKSILKYSNGPLVLIEPSVDQWNAELVVLQTTRAIQTDNEGTDAEYGTIVIPEASSATNKAGVMSVSDKSNLDTLYNAYTNGEIGLSLSDTLVIGGAKSLLDRSTANSFLLIGDSNSQIESGVVPTDSGLTLNLAGIKADTDPDVGGAYKIVDSNLIFQFPATTSTTAGVMSASDKKLINSLPTNILSDLNINEFGSDYIELVLDQAHKNDLGVYTTLTATLNIPAADPNNAGLMSTADKLRLDNVPIEMKTLDKVSNKAFTEGELELTTNANYTVLYLPITKSGYYTVDGTDTLNVAPNVFTMTVWNTALEFNMLFTNGVPVNANFWSEVKKGKTWWDFKSDKVITLYLTAGLVLALSGLNSTLYNVRYIEYPGLMSVVLASLKLSELLPTMSSVEVTLEGDLKAQVLSKGTKWYYIELTSDSFNDNILLILNHLSWSETTWSLYFQSLDFYINSELIRLVPRIDFVGETGEVKLILSNQSN